MQNIPEDDGEQMTANQPRSLQPKSSTKIINNRYINQNIYKMFLQKRYDQCLKFISRCQEDEFKIYIKALIAKNQFKLDKALDFFSQCQVLDRTNYHYLKHMAKTFILLGKFKSGLEVAKDALKINSQDAQIHYIFGKLSLALKDSKNAQVHFDLSLNKQKNEAAFIQKAKILYQNKQFDDALIVLQAATDFSSQNAEVYQMMAEIKYQKGQVQKSIHDYKKALEIDGERFNSLLSLGSMSQVQDETDSALEFYKKAHKMSPNSAPLWNNLGIHMYEKKKIIAAYSCFKRALFLDPFRWDIHANLGLLFMKHRKYLQAEIHFKSAVKIKKDGALFNLWGLCLRNLNDTRNAEACFLEGMKLEPENEQIRYNFMLALKQNKKDLQARKQFKQFMQEVSDPKIKRALYEVKDRFQ